jgi:hypothetical protein
MGAFKGCQAISGGLPRKLHAMPPRIGKGARHVKPALA